MAELREIVYCDSASAWEEWLEKNSESSPGVRLAIAKKGSAHTSPSYAEAVEAALCFGWIDGVKGRLDDDHYLQLFTRRGTRSIWSRINRDTATRLIESGRMRPSGLAAVDAAKADGRWDRAYVSHSTAEVPDDLAAALAAHPDAAGFWPRLTSQNRFAVLFRISTVKRPETRARKIAEYVAMLDRGETLYPQKLR